MLDRAAEQLLYDSEITLRLVDTVLEELQQMEAEVSRSEDRLRQLGQQVNEAHAGIADLPALLLRAYGEIQNGLESLRQSRDVLERATVEKIRHMDEKLREVTSATEVAASDILDGLDRALALIDRLDTLEPEGAPERAESQARLVAELRDELFGLVSSVQFQDITSQQLTYASSVLHEMEGRLAQLAVLCDPARLGLEPPSESGQPDARAANAGDGAG